MTKVGFLAAVAAIDGDVTLFNKVQLTSREDNEQYIKITIETSDAKQYNLILKNSIDTTSADYVIFDTYATEMGGGLGRKLIQTKPGEDPKLARTTVYLDYLSIVSVFAIKVLTVEANLTAINA